MSMSVPLISVVVCTYNRAGMLADALASLAAQQMDGRFEYEVLVVDNASTDETPAIIANAAQAADGLIRGVREPMQGIVPARNCGLREARGQWIAFFNDDQIAELNWLAELFAMAGRKQV